MLPFLNRNLLLITRWSAWIGMMMLIGAMLATTADVLLRKLFGYTYPGTIDIVQLLVLSAAFLAIPYAFITRSHVAVAILTEKLHGRWKQAIEVFSGVLGLGLMACFTWFGYQQAMMQLEYGDVSQTIGIPMIWFWIPLIYGCLLSMLVCLLLTFDALYHTLYGDERIA